jgi:hypothetical protein
MKIRRGFVSNSSSCSFTCDVCGHTEGGFDASPEDCGFYCCANGHTFCQDDLLEMPDAKEEKERDEYGFDEDGFDEYGRSDDNEYKPELCPICQMVNISKRDMDEYVYKMYGKSKKELEAEIRSKFDNYDKFNKWLNK